MTPEDAAEERLEEDVIVEEEEEEDAFFRLDELSVLGSTASVDEALSRVDLRECAAILLHVSMFTIDVTVEREDEARSICEREKSSKLVLSEVAVLSLRRRKEQLELQLRCDNAEVRIDR